MDKVHFTTGKDDWETPDELFRKYDSVYHFILDAAANERNHKVDQWFGPGGVEEDALTADWEPWLQRGNIWLNPPYSRGLQEKFVRKASGLEQVRYYGHFVVCLLPARTDTKLFHEVILPFGTTFFLKGRVKFIDPTGEPLRRGTNNSAPFPSMIIEFGG